MPDDVRRAMRSARGAGDVTRDRASPLIMLAPSLVIFGVFVYYPFLKNFQLAFYRQSVAFGNSPRDYVGFDQIKRRARRRTSSATACWVTVRVRAAHGPGRHRRSASCSPSLAHQTLRGIGVYRTIFSSTVASSVAVASVIFLTLLNPQIGLVNYYLDRQGGESLLQDPTWALPMVALVTIWQSLGITFILMSSALQAIPDELFEARASTARARGGRSGRSRCRCSRRRSSSRSSSARISAWQAFGQVDLLTQGGPVGKTNVLTYSIYTTFFERRNEGAAAVQSIALFFIVLVLTLIQLRFLERRVHYAR